jgi:uncharacterized membrane protein YeaQ/YmgE (transglycosylase-associated protein family)
MSQSLVVRLRRQLRLFLSLSLAQWRPRCVLSSNPPASHRTRGQITLAPATFFALALFCSRNPLCAGVLAKLITPGSNEPQGFILTTILGIVGAFVATYLGQALGWYRADEGAGLIGATVGAVMVLMVWAAVTRPRSVP